MVDAEHAQSERMRGTAPPDDHWGPYAQQFVADPRRSDDPLLERLLHQVMPRHSVIDVGAGAGRLALPLALRCRQVIAVEPSPSMAAVLMQQAAEHSIRNVSLVQALWEDAEVQPADVVLCSHVVYTIRAIEPFLRRLEEHAQERVLAILFSAPPQSQLYEIWKQVHHEERLPLPGLPQFEEVLKELGIDAHVEVLPTQPHRGYDSPEQAMEQLSRRLFLAPGGPKEALLQKMLPEVLEEVDGAFRVRGAQPLEPALVWWRPPPVS